MFYDRAPHPCDRATKKQFSKRAKQFLKKEQAYSRAFEHLKCNCKSLKTRLKSENDQKQALLKEIEESKAEAASSDKEHIERSNQKDSLIADFQNRSASCVCFVVLSPR